MFDGIKNTLGTAQKAMQAKQQQERMQKLMATVVVTGSSKNGKLSVTVDGTNTILSVKIEPALINFVYESSTSKGIEDTLLPKCFKEALEDANKKLQPELMKKLQESGNLGDLMSMLGGG
jgi:DNA-binding protein YbaB